MEQLSHLAQFIAGTTYDTLPSEVIERALWVIRDTTGVIIGGMGEPEVDSGSLLLTIPPDHPSRLSCLRQPRPIPVAGCRHQQNKAYY